MAAFLVVLGATGSLIAFNDELEAWISPQLFRVQPPGRGAPLLDPFLIRDRALAHFPGAEANWVDLSPEPGRSVVVGLDPAPGAAAPFADDQVFVDPYTGHVLGSRAQGDLAQGWKNLMPFVYRLHTSLALGDMGAYVLGVAALLWSIDCFVGLYLTLPPRRVSRRETEPLRRSQRPWHSRWAAAWKVRGRGSPSKLVFDLHRAGGLWTWVMLFVLAWSGVGFNLSAVYQPVMRALAGYAPPEPDGQALPPRNPEATPIGWTRAREIARDEMNRAAEQRGFTVRRERLIHFDAAHGRYEYRVLSTLDVGSKLGNTTLYVDAANGALLDVDLPTGQHPGNTIDTWLSSLHTAAWGGIGQQFVLCLVGIVVVVLSSTGIWIWWRRRRAGPPRELGRIRPPPLLSGPRHRQPAAPSSEPDPPPPAAG